MMTRRMGPACLAVLLITAGLAGCIGTDDRSPPTQEGPDPGPTTNHANESSETGPALEETTGTDPLNESRAPTLRMVGCTEHIGLFPIPAPLAQLDLPEGFEPEPFEGIPGSATYLVLGLGCDLGSFGSQGIGDPGLMATGYVVQPPSQLAASVDRHIVFTGGAVEAPALAGLLAGWGLPVEEGTFSQNSAAVAAGSTTGSLLASADGFHAAMVSNAGPRQGTEAGYTARAFAVTDGQVQGHVDIETNGTVAGSLGEATLQQVGAPALHQGIGIHRVEDGYTYELTPHVS